MIRPYIKNSEMDVIAESILLKAVIPISWEGKVSRINIDSIIEFTYDLEISWENIDHLSKDGVVLAAINPKNKIIYMNETQKDLFTKNVGTMNFSKAHELGHWILHVTKQRDYEQISFLEGETYLCRGGLKKPPEEFQADMFAASILMPKKIITGAINLLKEREKITFPVLYRLADEFEVSISALTNRLRELNLLYIKEKTIYMSKAEATGQLSLI